MMAIIDFAQCALRCWRGGRGLSSELATLRMPKIMLHVSKYLAASSLLAWRCNASKHAPEVQELVDWFEARDGAELSPKLEIRHANYAHDSQEKEKMAALGTDNDTSSTLGVFAAADIAEGEVLLVVPWNSIIHAGYTLEDPPPLVCDTVLNLAKEIRKGPESDFAPYVNYLRTQKVGQIPSAWSDGGKQLLYRVLGRSIDQESGWARSQRLPPKSPTARLDVDWRQDCNGSTDPIDEQAAQLVIQRAEDDLMMPIYDMFSHRNGWHNNVENNFREGGEFNLTAKRDIAKGEMLYNSYNQCTGCEGRAGTYGTPEIFRDYGFVEQYPQRWIFADQSCAFDLEENEGVIKVNFGKGIYTASNETIKFFRQEICRLEKIKELEEGNADIDPFEFGMLWDYVDALIKAMAHAIEATPGANSDFVCEEESSKRSCSANGNGDGGSICINDDQNEQNC